VLRGWKVDRTGSGSFPIAGFDISVVESTTSANKESLLDESANLKKIDY